MDAPVHGNFRRYYGMRSARAAARAHTIGHDAVPPPRADGVDERVAALVAWLALHEHRVDRVLDIGCNAAKPLLELCAMLEHMPQRVVGVDIDGALIGQARTALRAAWSQRAPDAPSGSVDAMRHFPACFASVFAPLPLPPPPAFPTNVSFIKDDWVSGRATAQDDRIGYDLILCFSLSKWVHLNQGDAGLVRLLARIAAVLRPGGIVALEVQPWRSYDQARSIARALRAAYTQLRLRPDDMAYIAAHAGLNEVGHLAKGAGYGAWARPTDSGFSRPVYLFQRGPRGPNAKMLRMAEFHWPWVARAAKGPDEPRAAWPNPRV